MIVIIYGIHSITSLLKREKNRFLEVWVVKNNHYKSRIKTMIRKLESERIWIQFSQKYEKVVKIVHPGIFSYIRKNIQYKENDIKKLLSRVTTPPLLLILENVTDPHNLGACLRNADAAGVHAMIVPQNRAATINSVAKKVSCGSAEIVPLIIVTNLIRTLRFLQKMKIFLFGTLCETTIPTLYKSTMICPLALIIGSEGEGIRRLTCEYCDELIRIPMRGMISSLNVSVATGIFLFEVLRQRSS